MNFKLILVGCIISAIAVAQIAAGCDCGAVGEDVCSCSLTRVPRPQQLPRFRQITRLQPNRNYERQQTCKCASSSQNLHEFRPVGDRCSCGNSAVLPAIRPPCKCQKNEFSTSTISDAPSDCGRTIHAPFESTIYTTNHIKKEDHHHLIPIDPVSMSLAYDSAQRATVMVPEEKLAYGFKKLPTNAETLKSVPNIPEEKLYTFDSKVVELKDIPCRRKHKKEEEELEEEEEEEEDETKPNCGLGYLNYHQMGYVPHKHIDPHFAVTQFVTEEVVEPPCNKEKVHEIGNCGYRPGRILNRADNDEIQGFVNQYSYEESSS